MHACQQESARSADAMTWWRKSGVDPDHAWRRQNNEQQHNVLYKYINLQRQGRLIDVYNRQGLEVLNAVIRDELGVFLYNDGKGKLVSTVEPSGRKCDANMKVRNLRVAAYFV